MFYSILPTDMNQFCSSEMYNLGFLSFPSFLTNKAWFFKNLQWKQSWYFIFPCFKSVCQYAATAAMPVSLWIANRVKKQQGIKKLILDCSPLQTETIYL